MSDASASAAVHFLPWVRAGAAAGITAGPTLGKRPQPAPGQTAIPSQAPVPVTVRLRGDTAEDIPIALRLYGPGDVLGMDPREIVRTEPRPLTPDFPPHLVPFIEFDRPDFPWLFTPAAPDNDGCLRPWIVLAVVRKHLARLTPDPRRPLPVLECPVTELPDLEESWAWAHAQFTGNVTSNAGLQGATGTLASRPQQTVSRLLCPRKLEPRREGVAAGYYACLVPAFAAGRKAGLGEPLTAEDDVLQPAWTLATSGQVTLPVYYHWEFSTADEGDFEDLVDRLRLLEPPLVGAPRLLDVRQPGGGMSTYEDATLGIATALQVPGAPPPAWSAPPSVTFADFQRELQAVLEAPATAPAGVAPALAPPVYGRWYVASPGDTTGGDTLSLDLDAAPAWLRDLNLDPRYRVAAALGTQVVLQQQEHLVAAAWEQVAQLKAVNQWLRQKQLAREVTASIHRKRLGVLSPAALFQITAPVPAAAAAPEPIGSTKPGPPALDTPTNALLDAFGSAPFRRTLRPLGPLARQGAVTGAPANSRALPRAVAMLSSEPRGLTALLERIRAGLVQVAPPPGAPAGALALAGSSRQLATAPLVSATVTATGALAVAPAASDEQAALLLQLDPHTTFTQEARTRVEVPPDMASLWSRPDVLQPVTVVPSFPQPMSEPLRELFQDMLVSGLDQMPHNSITLLQTNPRFIEAYLVGLNHELSHELLWREYPTDLQGTYFRQFWDVRGRLAPSATAAERAALADIPPIADWHAPLGENMPAGRGQHLVLLLMRGDLLLRYPTALIYAARARWSQNAQGHMVRPPVIDTDPPTALPVLRITPAPGVTLLGFTLDPPPSASAAPPDGDPGWFFVIAEHPTEARFGLDLNRDALTSWRELSWQDVRTRADGSGYMTVTTAAPRLEGTPTDTDRDVVWGKNGAHMASIMLQTPYRLQIHASVWFGCVGERQ